MLMLILVSGWSWSQDWVSRSWSWSWGKDLGWRPRPDSVARLWKIYTYCYIKIQQ